MVAGCRWCRSGDVPELATLGGATPGASPGRSESKASQPPPTATVDTPAMPTILTSVAVAPAPAADLASTIVEMAEFWLSMQEDFDHWLAYEYLKLTGDKAEAVLTTKAEVRAKKREGEAEHAAALLRKIWNQHTANG